VERFDAFISKTSTLQSQLLLKSKRN